MWEGGAPDNPAEPMVLRVQGDPVSQNTGERNGERHPRLALGLQMHTHACTHISMSGYHTHTHKIILKIEIAGAR